MKQLSEAFSARLHESNITRLQWICMYYVLKNEPISQRDLSFYMHIKDSSVGRLIDRMERDGLVFRKRSDEDRRIVLVHLTDGGKSLIKELLPLGERFHEDLMQTITEDELEVFENVLKKMVDNVKNGNE